VVALDDRHLAARSEHAAQVPQRVERPRQVLEDETNEHVVEAPLGERQAEGIGLHEEHVVQALLPDAAARSAQGVAGQLHRDDAGASVLGRDERRLGPTPQPTSRTRAPGANAVSWWSRPASVAAWSPSRSASSAE